MKDKLGQTAEVGDYFAYAQRSGNSVWTELMRFEGVNDKGNVRALGMDESRRRKFGKLPDGTYGYIAIEPKLSTLLSFSERAIIMKGYKPE